MQYELAFAMVLDSRPDEESQHYFVADSDEVYMIWTDGINVLVNSKVCMCNVYVSDVIILSPYY